MKPPTNNSPKNRALSPPPGGNDALRESEKSLRQIIDLVPHFVFAKDAQGRFLLINRALAEAYGTTVEKALGRTDADFSPTPEEVRHFRDEDTAVLRRGKPRTVTTEPITDSGGNVRFLHTTKIPFQFGPEKTPGILGVAVDITDLKRSEQRLQESEEKYRNFVERAHDGIAVIQDGIVKYLNPVLADFFGGPIEQIIGTEFTRYVHQDELAKLAENYRRRIEGLDVPSTYDTILLRSDGHPLPVEVNAGRIQYDGRSADLVIIRDTRERRKGEDAVARRNAILKIVRDAAEQFLKSPEPESTINDLLKRLGRVLRVDRTCIVENSREANGSLAGFRKFAWTSDGAGPGDPGIRHVCYADPAYERWKKVMEIGDVIYGETALFPPAEQAVLGEGNIRSVLAVPIFAGKEWWGFIECDDCRSDRTWSLLETDAVGSLANILGAVMHRRKTEKVQHAVYRIAQAAGSASGIQELCRSVHGIVAEIMEARNFYVALYDGKEEVLSFPYFEDEFDPPAAPKKLSRGLTEYILRTGRSLLCTGEKFAGLIASGEAELIGKPSAIWLGVPLNVEDRTIGAMVVQHYTDPRAYGEREQEILEYVSSQIARAIDRKRAEEALVSQTAYFQRLFEDAPAGIALMDTSDCVVSVNRSFQEMFGYASGEIRGLNINDIIVPPQLRGEARQLSAASQHGDVVSKESVRRRRDGTNVDVHITGYPILIEGKRVGVYGMYENISARKVLEAQVLQAQKMQSIGTLAGGIAHDFNNILAIILGHLSLMERTAHDPVKRSTSIRAITKAAERAAGVVRQLLTFARKNEGCMEPVRLNDVVRELLKFLDETLPKNISITTDLAVGLPAVVADATQIHRVLLNLCVNARDAMPHGGTLSIATRAASLEAVRARFPLADAPGYIEIRTGDTGTGMDETTRRRIFEPFFTTKEPGRGTGLGMAVVFGIVESHHGFIYVESRPGEGSMFTIYIPVSAVPLPGDESSDAIPSAPGAGTETILIVEDEEALSDLLEATLASAGYRVLKTSDGLAALEEFRAHRSEISLVISDVGLPKMSGDQAYTAMREVDPGVRTILASGYMEPDTKAEVLDAGVRAFLQKPYEMHTVLAEVRRVLDSR
jgi:two-component system, cell cycle sensor histidine kinase and response regulator CckA